jgi:hypothetical protein
MEFISLLLLQEKQCNEILKNSLVRDQVVRTTLEEHLTRKRPAEEASPIITSPGLKSGDHTTRLDSSFEYTPTTWFLDSSSEYTPTTRLDSSSEYIPS